MASSSSGVALGTRARMWRNVSIALSPDGDVTCPAAICASSFGIRLVISPPCCGPEATGATAPELAGESGLSSVAAKHCPKARAPDRTAAARYGAGPRLAPRCERNVFIILSGPRPEHRTAQP